MKPDKYQYYDIGLFRIEFYRYHREMSYSKYSQYDFKIIFKDKNTNIVIVEIDANEKLMYDMVINFYQYNMYSSDQMSSERTYFGVNSDGNRYIMEISAIYVDYPTELEFSNLILYQYNQYTDQIIQRLWIQMDEFQIEDFIYQAWLTLEGIDYLQEIGRSELDDYLGFIGDNMNSINLE